MLDRLELFYHITKLGSFSKASQARNISQSALSRSIKMLEHQLGYKVFHRKTSGLELTSKGRKAFDTAEKMYLSLQNLKANDSEENSIRGKIRVSTTISINDCMLQTPLESFMKLHPEIRFEAACNDESLDIYLNEVDVSIRPYDSITPDLTQKHLFTMKAKLFASRSYIEKYGEPKNVDDLDHHRLLTRIQPEMHLYSDIEWPLRVGRPQNNKRQAYFSSNSTESLYRLAKRGYGIFEGYYGMSIWDNANLINILPELEGPCYKFYFIYPNHLRQSRKIKAFEKHLMNHFTHLRKDDVGKPQKAATLKAAS